MERAVQRESRRSAPKNSPNESAMADEYPAPAPPPAQISQAPRPYMMDFKVPEDVFIEDEEEMPPEPITYIDDPIAEPDPNTPPISPRPIDVPMPRNVPTPQVPVPQQPLLPKQPKPISNVENPLPKHEPTTPVVTHPQVEEPKPNDPAATKPSTDEPSKEEKLEDEDALLPLSPNLPPFEFAGYESDEDAFVDRLYTPPGEDPRKYNESKLADPVTEKWFYDMLVGALQTYRSEIGRSPTVMPVTTLSFDMRPFHLKALARVIKDPLLCSDMTSFEADPGHRWKEMKGLGLKWILNAIAANKSIKNIALASLVWDAEDGRRLVRCITNSPHIESLTFKYMTNHNDDALKVLLKSLYANTTIKRLSLAGTTFSETTFNMLICLISTNVTIEFLSLSLCDFTYHNRMQRFMQAIIENTNTKLRDIEYPLMRGAVLMMAQMLQYNRTITTVNLSGIALGPHVTILQHALAHNHVMQSLKLSNTGISDQNLAVLLDPLWTNSALKTFDISSNSKLTKDSAKNIGDMLMQNNGIEELNVSSLQSMPKDALAKYIGRALRSNATIHVLNLSSTNTESAGAAILGDALAVNHGLHVLDLSNNYNFDDTALTALLKSIRTCYGLHTLNVSKCKLGDASAKILVPWLKGTATFTQRLDLSSNRLSATSLEFLLDAVKANPVLRSFELVNGAQTRSFFQNLTTDIRSLFV